MPKQINNQLDIINEVDRLIKEAESQVEILLAKRLHEILNILNSMYSKFVLTNESSYTDLNKYNRLSKELERISEQLSNDYQQIVQMIANSTRMIYVEQYLMYDYLFQVFLSTELGFSIATENTVAAALVNPIEFLTLPKVMEKQRNETIRSLQIEIASSLLSGEGYWHMAKRIEKAMGFSQHKARMVARTEGGRARSLSDEAVTSEMEQYVELSKIWLSTLDNRTRHEHIQLDGEKADKEGYFHYHGMKSKGPHLWNIAKMDINCRCVTIKLIDGYLPAVRRGRDYRDATYQQNLADCIDLHMGNGNTYIQAYKKADKEILPPSTLMNFVTYDEWLKKL